VFYLISEIYKKKAKFGTELHEICNENQYWHFQYLFLILISVMYVINLTQWARYRERIRTKHIKK